jgi:predicted NodU family carbamoyl transferase
VDVIFVRPATGDEGTAVGAVLSLAVERFAARDFVDVFALSHTYSTSDLLTWAREVNSGFHLPYFVEALDALPRLRTWT